MNKSESIAQLAEALSKAQAEMAGAKKDMANPFFKSKYADLASVWDACREPLGKYGLSVSQMPETRDTYVVVTTMLMHSSGEWLANELAMMPVKNDPQGIGSCITYIRRYSLAAIVGIAPEDDDGNQASGRKDVQRTTEATPIAAPRKAAVTANIKGAEPQAAAIQQEAGIAASTREPDLAAKIFAQVEAKVRDYEREPGSGDGDACIDLPRQKNLHISFKRALKNQEAQDQADIWLEQWLKNKGYRDKDGRGTSATIPKLLFEEVKREAVKYAENLPK